MPITLSQSKKTKAFLAKILAFAKAMDLLPRWGTKGIHLRVEDGFLVFLLQGLGMTLRLSAEGEVGGALPSIILSTSDFLPLIKGASSLTLAASDAGVLVSTDIGTATIQPCTLDPIPAQAFRPALQEDGSRAKTFEVPFLTSASFEFAAQARCRETKYKPSLASVFFEIGDSGALAIVSSDGFHLAVVEGAIKATSRNHPAPAQVVVSPAGQNVLTGILGMGGPFRATFGSRSGLDKDGAPQRPRPCALFQVPGASLWFDQDESRHYPNWRRVVPELKTLSASLVIEREALLRATKAAAAFGDDYNRCLVFTPAGEKGIRLSLQQPDRGIWESFIPVLQGALPARTAFNVLYLRDLAQESLSPQITLRMHPKQENGAVAFETALEGATAFMLSMPLQVGQGEVPAPQDAGAPPDTSQDTSCQDPAAGIESEASEGPATAGQGAQEAPDAPGAPHEGGPLPEPQEPASLIFRSDVAAVQSLGGLKAMHAYPVARWHGYKGSGGPRRQAVAWSVPQAKLVELSITPLDETQARQAHQDRRERKTQRRERALSKAS